MAFTRFALLVFSLGLIPGATASAGGNQCEIHKNQHKCDGLDGPKLERVKELCEKLLKEHQEARKAAKASCAEKLSSTAFKSGCQGGAQSGLDSCNAAADERLRNNFASSAATQRGLAKKIKEDRKKLEEAIHELEGDPDVDQSQLSMARDVTDESRDQIEGDVNTLAQQNSDDASKFGSIGTEGDGNASALASPDSSPAASAAPAADVASAEDPSAASSSTGAADGAQVAALSSGAGAAGAAAQSFPASGSAGSPVFTGGNGPSAAAPTPAPAASGTQLASVFSSSPGASATVAARSSAGGASGGVVAASTTGVIAHAEAAAPSSPSGAPAAAADGMREELRRRMLASGTRAADAASSAAAEAATNLLASQAKGARALASLATAGGTPELPESSEQLESFGIDARESRFSMLNSDTEASVKKIVRDLSGIDPGTQGSSAEIGELNGPSLFARSHATIERSIRDGRVRGVAMR